MVGSAVNAVDDIIRVFLTTADDAGRALATVIQHEEAGPALLQAIRGGDEAAVRAAIESVDGGADLLRSGAATRLTGIMARFGDDFVENLNGLETALRSGDEAASLRHFENTFGSQYLTPSMRTALQTRAQSYAAALSDDALAIARGGADEVLESGADIARTAGPRLSNGEVRFLRTDRVLTYAKRGLAATVIGGAIIEVESGGALSQMTLEGLIDAVEYAREHDLPFVEDLAQRAFEGIAQVNEWMHAGRTTAHNAAIMMALGDAEEASPEDIAAARTTAISWQITNPLGIAADAYLVSQRIRLENPDMPQDDRDALVADALIDRMVENANMSALAGIGESVTREDVEAYMREHASQIAALPPEMSRIKTALVAAVPGLDTAVASAEAEAPAAGPFGRVYTALTDETPAEEIRAMFAAASSNIDDLNLGVGQRIGFEVLSGISGLIAGLGAIVSMFNEAAGTRLMTMAANMERTALTATGVDERMAALSRDATAGEVVADGGDPFEVTTPDGRDPALTVPAHG